MKSMFLILCHTSQSFILKSQEKAKVETGDHVQFVSPNQMDSVVM